MALPTAQWIDGHRALETDDNVRPAPSVFDVEAAGALALAEVDQFDATTWEIEGMAATLGPEPPPAFEWVRDRLALARTRACFAEHTAPWWPGPETPGTEPSCCRRCRARTATRHALPRPTSMRGRRVPSSGVRSRARSSHRPIPMRPSCWASTWRLSRRAHGATTPSCSRPWATVFLLTAPRARCQLRVGSVPMPGSSSDRTTTAGLTSIPRCLRCSRETGSSRSPPRSTDRAASGSTLLGALLPRAALRPWPSAT